MPWCIHHKVDYSAWEAGCAGCLAEEVVRLKDRLARVTGERDEDANLLRLRTKDWKDVMQQRDDALALLRLERERHSQ